MRKTTLALVTWVWLVVPAAVLAQDGLILRISKPACPAGSCTTVVTAAPCAPVAACAPCKPEQHGILSRFRKPACDATSHLIPAESCAVVPACAPCKPEQHGVLAKVKKHHADAMTDPCQHGVLAHSYQRRTCSERQEKHDHFLDWLCYRPGRGHCEKKHECCCVPPLYMFFLCASCGAGCGTCGR